MRTTPFRGGTDPVTELDEISHRFCDDCNNTKAICGFDAGGYELEDVEIDDLQPCPICESIVDAPCPWCGAP